MVIFSPGPTLTGSSVIDHLHKTIYTLSEITMIAHVIAKIALRINKLRANISMSAENQSELRRAIAKFRRSLDNSHDNLDSVGGIQAIIPSDMTITALKLEMISSIFEIIARIFVMIRRATLRL
jgi:hypothetical protein